MKHIQIFTDGGIFKLYNIAASVGIICIDGNEIIKFEKISHYKDSDYAELFAINKALSRVYGRLMQHDMYNDAFEISLYTDSKASLTSILSKQSNCNPDNKNRLTMLNEINEGLKKINKPINFYHINSHISDHRLNEYYVKYCNENQSFITFNEFLYIVKQNKKCDNLVKKVFKKYNKKKKTDIKHVNIEDTHYKIQIDL